MIFGSGQMDMGRSELMCICRLDRNPKETLWQSPDGPIAFFANRKSTKAEFVI